MYHKKGGIYLMVSWDKLCQDHDNINEMWEISYAQYDDKDEGYILSLVDYEYEWFMSLQKYLDEQKDRIKLLEDIKEGKVSAV